MAAMIAISLTCLLPIGTLVFAWRKKGIFIWLAGALAFTVAQLVIRLPLLQWIQMMPTVRLFSMMQPIIWLVILALTAGIVEECARYLVFTCYKKAATNKGAFLYGLGHGGIEAFLLVGIPFVIHLASMPSATLYAGSVERLLAMAAHICFSFIVVQAVLRQQVRYVSYAIVAHTLFNLVGAWAAARYTSLVVIEGVILLEVIGLIVVTIIIVKGNGYEKVNMDR